MPRIKIVSDKVLGECIKQRWNRSRIGRSQIVDRGALSSRAGRRDRALDIVDDATESTASEGHSDELDPSMSMTEVMGVG